MQAHTQTQTHTQSTLICLFPFHTLCERRIVKKKKLQTSLSLAKAAFYAVTFSMIVKRSHLIGNNVKGENAIEKRA